MDPSMWAWFFLISGALFAVGEMLTPGAFFLAPFAVGGGVAAVTGFLGLPGIVQCVVFLVASTAAFAGMRPLARRLDAGGGNPLGVGAGRLVGATAVVVESIPAGQTEMGLVRIGREDWRARTIDNTALPLGASVTVVEVEGTSVVVHGSSAHFPTTPPVS